jgi:eukaryotic-like serine/threonine-protein kinase
MSAVDKLLGLTLVNDWKVTRQLGKNPSGSGGIFSRGYIVEKSGKVGFLKAFDFGPALRPGVDTASEIQRLITAYNYEREILELCGEKRLSKVVLAIDSGSVRVEATMDGTVFYRVFEMAAGDVRIQMSTKTASDALYQDSLIRTGGPIRAFRWT